MKVAFFPYGTAQENPYQELLIKGLEANGIEVERIPGRKLFPLLPVVYSRSDIVHIFWPHDLYIGRNKLTKFLKNIMMLCTLPLLHKKKLVYSAENVASHMHGTTYAAEEIHWIQRILNHCCGIIMMNPVAPQVLMTFYTHLPQNQLSIPHVHYRSVYPDNISFEQARALLGLSPDATVFLIMGRIAPYKGIEEVIESFLQLDHPEAKLIIAGKSSDTSYMEHLEKIRRQDNRVILHNQYIHNNDVQLYFNAANAAIFNYQDIPLNPGSIIMAKGFGTRIVAPALPTLMPMDQGDMHFFMQGELSTTMQLIADSRVKPDKNNIDLNLAAHAPEEVGKQLTAFYYQCYQ